MRVGLTQPRTFPFTLLTGETHWKSKNFMWWYSMWAKSNLASSSSTYQSVSLNVWTQRLETFINTVISSCWDRHADARYTATFSPQRCWRHAHFCSDGSAARLQQTHSAPAVATGKRTPQICTILSLNTAN